MRALRTLAVYAVLLLGVAITIGPYLLTLSTSFKGTSDFYNSQPWDLPSPFTTANYRTLFADHAFGLYFRNTVFVVACITVGQIVFSILAAYAFARLDFVGREPLFWLFLATLMVPNVVTIIPLFVMMKELGWPDTFKGLIVPYVLGSPYAVFLLRQYFRGIPRDLEAAARIDGAGTLGVLRWVIVPLSRPIIATLALITLVTHWNNFLWPLVVSSTDRTRVITVGAASLQSQYNSQWGMVTAASLLALLPLLVLFPLIQRHVVRSISVTGLK
jgi:multiple sugar transport system permease protein